MSGMNSPCLCWADDPQINDLSGQILTLIASVFSHGNSPVDSAEKPKIYDTVNPIISRGNFLYDSVPWWKPMVNRRLRDSLRPFEWDICDIPSGNLT